MPGCWWYSTWWSAICGARLRGHVCAQHHRHRRQDHPRAVENGEPVDALTERFIAAMHEDSAALGVLPPDLEPRATRSMPQIIAMIRTPDGRGLCLSRARTATCTTTSAASPITAGFRASASKSCVPASRVGDRRGQGGPAGLRPVEGGQAGRAELGRHPGAPAARAGTSSARPCPPLPRGRISISTAAAWT